MTGRILLVVLVTLASGCGDRGGRDVTGPGGLRLGAKPSPGATSPPIRASAGQVIRGVKITSTAGPCVTIDNAANVVIEGVEIGPCGGNGVEISGSGSRRIRITGSYIHTERSGAAGMNSGLGVFVRSGASDVLIEGNTFERNESGVYTDGGVSNIRVVGNVFRNPLGPFPRGQHVQLAHASGGQVVGNYGLSERGKSRQEDAVNLFQSRNIRVADNYLKGGDSASGCGIITDGGGGQDRNNVIEDNVVIGTAQCGIGIASGTNHIVRRNKILDTNIPNGSGNTALYVWNQYPGPCSGHVIADNLVSNRLPSGQYKDWWNGGNCGSLTLSNNVFGDAARPLVEGLANRPPPDVE